MALADKVLILGVDGLDPSLTKKFMDQGKLPNFKKIVERGAQREDLVMLGAVPTITPPLWTTLATGAYPGTHGITCFWNQDPERLDTMVYSLDSRMCKAEQLWNVCAESGMKTLVWHWPGSSWPPSSDSPNLHVVEGTQPASINSGVARIETEKLAVASTEITEVQYKPAASNDTGAGCIIEDLPEEDPDAEVFDATNNLIGGAKHVTNLILSEEDGELALDKVPFDLSNSPIKDAFNWADAPQGAKEFYIVTSNGLVRRPCLILQNEAGIYDHVAMYHSKKDIEPIVTLKLDEYVDTVLDTFMMDEEEVVGNRSMRLFEVAPDGSKVRLWLGKALDVSKDVLWHPKSLYKSVVENAGYVPVYAYSGIKNPVLVEKLIIRSWDHYTKWQAKALNHLIQEQEYQVVFSHCHNVDAQGHNFWYMAKARAELGNDYAKYLHAIEMVYEQTDRYIGEFLHFLDEGWTIFIVSDHGLIITEEEHPPMIGDAFGCNVRVMEELGYTVLKKDAQGKEIREIDWAKTRAVATRGGHIWINLKGRNATGIVEEADKYALEAEIISALYNYRQDGKRVIAMCMRNKDAALVGMSGPECGDIIYWLEEGFNRIHGDALPTQCGFADTSVSPIFIAAGKGLKQGIAAKRVIRQADFAPTVAAMLGIRMPEQNEGGVLTQLFA